MGQKTQPIRMLTLRRTMRKPFSQERRTFIKATKKARALGFDSKVSDRHLVVGEERITCETILEHLKESPWRLK